MKNQKKHLFQTICLPVVCSYNDENVTAEAKKQQELLISKINEGFTVTHITSSTVNGIMYAYHFLEKQEESA